MRCDECYQGDGRKYKTGLVPAYYSAELYDRYGRRVQWMDFGAVDVGTCDKCNGTGQLQSETV